MKRALHQVKTKIRHLWPLIKSPQTGLLLATGLAGYSSARCPVVHWSTLLALAVSLLLAISGSTVLNMWFDRDIDARMKRTSCRPIPSGNVRPGEALQLGLILSILGISAAASLSPLYGVVVFAGFFFDVVVYTIWLKRRTPWSIVWGGISGGMPILAGRVLGIGSIDWIGILLALAVLLWIPTHIMTFSLRYHDEYEQAGIPTFTAAYGRQITQRIIAGSSLGAALAIGLAAFALGTAWGYMRLLIVLSGGLLALAIGSLVRPSERVNFSLFKYASLFMLGSMLLFVLEAI